MQKALVVTLGNHGVFWFYLAYLASDCCLPLGSRKETGIFHGAETVLKDENYKLRAQEFSRLLKKNDGAEKAAKIILQHV